jgi:hypothetical protein
MTDRRCFGGLILSGRRGAGIVRQYGEKSENIPPRGIFRQTF